MHSLFNDIARSTLYIQKNTLGNQKSFFKIHYLGQKIFTIPLPEVRTIGLPLQWMFYKKIFRLFSFYSREILLRNINIFLRYAPNNSIQMDQN